MKKHLILLALILTAVFTEAQEQSIELPPIKHHSLYLELGGSSILYSLNYDYTFRTSEKTKLCIGVGAAAWAIDPIPSPDNKDAKTTFFPFITPHFNILHGRYAHHLETGAFLNTTLGPAPGIRVGYRYQKPTGGFLFRAGIAASYIGAIIPIPGLSFGYTF